VAKLAHIHVNKRAEQFSKETYTQFVSSEASDRTAVINPQLTLVCGVDVAYMVGRKLYEK
jgi:hypothetical protein